MRKTKLKAYSINFKKFITLASFIFVFQIKKLFATGDSESCDDLECISFFAPEIIENNQEAPFFRSNGFYYSHAPGAQESKSAALYKLNIQEWQTFFYDKLGSDLLGRLIYDLSLEDTLTLKKAIENNTNENLSYDLNVIKENLDKIFPKWRVNSSLEYLVLAKKVEPLAIRMQEGQEWEERPADNNQKGPDLVAANKLIVEAKKKASTTANYFIKNRYQFQILRLYFYSNQFQEAQNYYNKTVKSFLSQSSVKARFLELGAGSYYKDKKYGYANYLYSLVYDNYPALKRSAFFSFHPMEESDWQETLKFARSVHEREVLWQLLGVYADGLTAIKKIRKLNPMSKLLPLLLVREVNKAEEDWSSNQDRIHSPESFEEKAVSDLEAVGVERLKLIQTIADEGLTFKNELWQLSTAHLLVLAGQRAEAAKYLAKANSLINPSVIFKAQVRMTSFLNFLLSTTGADQSLENNIADELTWLSQYKSDENFRAAHLFEWALQYLSKIYE
jgi:hypothetical protein